MMMDDDGCGELLDHLAGDIDAKDNSGEKKTMAMMRQAMAVMMMLSNMTTTTPMGLDRDVAADISLDDYSFVDVGEHDPVLEIGSQTGRSKHSRGGAK